MNLSSTMGEKILQNSATCIVLVKEGIISFANSHFYNEILGFERQENIVGKNFTDIFYGDPKIPKDLSHLFDFLEDVPNNFLSATDVNGEIRKFVIKSLFAIDKNNHNFVLQLESLHEVINIIESTEIKYNILQDFTYKISHELLTSTRKTTNYLKLLKSQYGTSLDEKGQLLIRRAKEGATDLNRQIKGLLKLSRVSSKIKKKEVIDMDQAMKHLRNNFEKTLEDMNGKLQIDDNLPNLQGDIEQLLQLFQYVIENGLQYNTSEVPTVRISAKTKTYWVEYYISDNGIGISEDYFEDIFDVFRRLHNKSEYPDRIGLGLTLSKKIVTRHKGEILVRSEEGEGSTFVLRFPRNVESNPIKTKNQGEGDVRH